MPKPTSDTFVDLLYRSGLIEKDQLDGVLAQVREEGDGRLPEDVDQLAECCMARGLVTRWQADKLLEGRHKGFFLKRYRLLDHLGTGGMSSVYLAEHVLMQRRVAIKVLPRNRVEDTSYLARFHREVQAAAALDHRNIVRAYDVDNDGDIHFLVMEYVEGRDLQAIVRDDGPLPYADAADFIRQAAEGLAHAHEANLIHRDVKPANLLVDPKNVVKVLDLGLARFTDDDCASLTRAYDENVLGTADYLAPEQALDSHGVDARADMYSLGCSLYFLLVGHPPFPDGTLPQRLMAHQKQQPPPVRNERPDAPDDLVAICTKMMAKRPEQRYGSMHDVVDALADWLVAHGRPVEGGSSPSGGSSGRLVGAAARQATQSTGGATGSGSGRDRRDAPPKRTTKTGDSSPGRPPQRRAGQALQDTNDHFGPTSVGPGKPKTRTGSAASSSDIGLPGQPLKSQPLKSQPLKGQSPKKQSPKIQLPNSQSPDPKATPTVGEFVFQVNEDPMVARIRSRAALTPEQVEAYQARRNQQPVWLWASIGVGAALVVILFIVLLLRV
ncbi:MAG: serine/threonine-protein kinase [Patescibacteria group bacterium]|nr:serine/threonine-protein kinase [Patescibacteria group bacterium]